MKSPKHIFKDCECIKETSMALLVVDSLGSDAWIPKSQIDDDSDIFFVGSTGKLIVSAWFAGRIIWEEK